MSIIDVSPMLAPDAHYSTRGLNVDEIRAKSFAKMEAFLTAGQERAAATVKQVFTQVPTDRVVRARGIGFGAAALPGRVSVAFGGEYFGLHQHAMDQLAERAEIPTRYVRTLNATAWGRELLAENFRKVVANTFEDTDRLLTRAVGGEVRAVLSDRYRRIDARPDAETLLTVAKDMGAMVVDGSALDTKIALKIAVPRPLEVFPGEYMVFGLEYRNSDFGDGAKELRSFLLRLICLNGATRETELRQVHLGARLSQDVAYSDRTYQLDSEASASATKDLATHLLGPKRIDDMVEQIRAANDSKIDAKARLATLQKTGRLSQAEAKSVAETFNTPDVEVLPPGNTVWRFSNALSFLARETTDGYRKLELEKLAGEAIA